MPQLTPPRRGPFGADTQVGSDDADTICHSRPQLRSTELRWVNLYRSQCSLPFRSLWRRRGSHRLPAGRQGSGIWYILSLSKDYTQRSLDKLEIYEIPNPERRRFRLRMTNLVVSVV